jgi:aspartate aminotransferase
VVKTFSTLEKNKFFPTAAELEKQYTPKTKALIFSSPGNPSGMMIDAGLLKEILDWCRQKKVELIYDEIYERLALTDVKHISAAALDTTQGQDAMCVNAFSKSLAMTGWRLGYVVSHPQTIKALTALQTQFLTCVPGFIQDAAGWSMDRMEAFLVPVLEAYRRRLKLMLEGLAKIPGVKAYVPDGAFYVMLDIQKVIQSKGFRDDAHFAEALLGQEKTVVIPGGAMGAPGCVRLSFSTSDEEISKAIERLARFSKF